MENFPAEFAAPGNPEDFVDRIAGSAPSMPITRTEFEKFDGNETEKWGKVVKFACIRAE